MKTYYITTPIYYVNDVPHIGHAYTTLACDVLARFMRLDGYRVHFLTGTDEHGQKVEKAAATAGVSPQQFTDKVSQNFRDLARDMNISNDDFIRTTEPRHLRSCQAIWEALEKNGDIYLGKYAGWYAANNRPAGDITRHDRIRADDRIIANVNSSKDFRSRADLHAVTDDRRSHGIVFSGVADGDAMANQAVIANHRCSVNDDATVVFDAQAAADLRGIADAHAAKDLSELVENPVQQGPGKPNVSVRDHESSVAETINGQGPEAESQQPLSLRAQILENSQIASETKSCSVDAYAWRHWIRGANVTRCEPRQASSVALYTTIYSPALDADRSYKKAMLYDIPMPFEPNFRAAIDPAADAVRLSVIVPFYNESENILRMHEAIVRALEPLSICFEMVFVDDGSKDRTLERAIELTRSDSRLRVVKFRRNYGQTPAMAAGIEHARGKVLVTMDGDLQNDPADIGLFLEKIAEGYDIVVGWRHNRQDKLVSRKIPSRIANWLIGRMTRVPIHDNGCSLKAYRANVIRAVPLYSEMHRFIPAMASIAGARIKEIKVRHHARRFGQSKYGLSRVFKVLADVVAVTTITAFGAKPLRWFFFLALWPALAAFALAGRVAWMLATGDDAPLLVFMGSALLLGALSGFLLLCGLLAELVTHTGDLEFNRLAAVTARAAGPRDLAGSDR